MRRDSAPETEYCHDLTHPVADFTFSDSERKDRNQSTWNAVTRLETTQLRVSTTFSHNLADRERLSLATLEFDCFSHV